VTEHRVPGLNDLEQAVLNMLLKGDHPVLAILRQQTRQARLLKREQTGVGFFCDFTVDGEVPTAPFHCEIGDVNAKLEGLTHGAGFVLFVREGRIAMLEGYTYDEPWPDVIRGFSLQYSDPERSVELARLEG
jgi:hypothetical protein